MSGTDRLVPRFLSLFGSKAVSTLIAIVSTPIVARLLGAGGYGDYAVLLSIYSLYMIPISAAVTEGLQKFVAEEREEDHWRERVIRFYFLLGLGLVLVGVVVLAAFTWLGLAERLFGPSFTTYFYLLVGFVFVGQFRAIGDHTVLGFGLEHVSGPLGVLKKGGTVGVGIAVVVTAGLGVTGMLIGHIVANAVVFLVAAVVVLRRVSVRALVRPAGSPPYRTLLSFSGLNVVLILLVMSLFHVDVVMVRALVGSDETGYYKAALSMAEYLWIVPIVLQSLLLHSSSTLWSNEDHAAITALASRVTRYTTLLVLLMGVGLATMAHRVVPLYYGQAFAVATGPLLLLLPGAAGFAVARPLQAICQGSGRLKPLLAATGVAAAVNAGLNAALIPRFGMYGAAVATSVGYGSMFVLLVRVAHRLGYDPLADFRPLRIAATVAVAAGPIYLVDAALTADAVALVVVPPLGGAVFLGAAFLTGALDRDEVADVLGRLPEPLDAAAGFVR